MKLIPPDECKSKEMYGAYVNDNMVCAGFAGGVEDTCQVAKSLQTSKKKLGTAQGDGTGLIESSNQTSFALKAQCCQVLTFAACTTNAQNSLA